MARYDVTYTCGHTGTVNLIGHHTYRERRFATLQESVCLDCYKEQQVQIAQEVTKERDFIPLCGGSQAQINWAMSIRIRILDELEKNYAQLLEQQELSPKEERLILLAIDALYQTDSAPQWIDWRDDSIEWILHDIKRKLLKTPTPTQVSQQQQKAMEKAQIEATARAEATLRPEHPCSETSAEITHTADIVCVRFPENREDFNTVVRGLGYEWDRAHRQWQRKLQINRTGSARDRAVELGHVLLSHDFCVCVFDADLRTGIIDGTFEQEHTRWIAVLVKGDYVGWFYIQWGHSEDYYDVARRIPKSRYYKPFVVVPPASFAELLDFAERYDFCLTKRAQEVVNQAKEQRQMMLVVRKDEPIPAPQKVVASVVPPVLAIPDRIEVAEELVDADHD